MVTSITPFLVPWGVWPVYPGDTLTGRVHRPDPFHLCRFASDKLPVKEIDVNELRPYQHEGHYAGRDQPAKARAFRVFLVRVQGDIVVLPGEGEDLLFADDHGLKIKPGIQPDIFVIQ